MSDIVQDGSEILAFAEAGYDEVYIQQIGPDQKPFFDLYEKETLPEFR